MNQELEEYLREIDFFGMVDRFWADHESVHNKGLVEATPQSVIAQTLFPPTEENLQIITDHFFNEMRKEWPNSILVCHL